MGKGSGRRPQNVSDEELEKLESDYIVQKEMSGGQVCMILYKKKN